MEADQSPFAGTAVSGANGPGLLCDAGSSGAAFSLSEVAGKCYLLFVPVSAVSSPFLPLSFSIECVVGVEEARKKVGFPPLADIDCRNAPHVRNWAGRPS